MEKNIRTRYTVAPSNFQLFYRSREGAKPYFKPLKQLGREVLRCFSLSQISRNTARAYTHGKQSPTVRSSWKREIIAKSKIYTEPQQKDCPSENRREHPEEKKEEAPLRTRREKGKQTNQKKRAYHIFRNAWKILGSNSLKMMDSLHLSHILEYIRSLEHVVLWWYLRYNHSMSDCKKEALSFNRNLHPS